MDTAWATDPNRRPSMEDICLALVRHHLANAQAWGESQVAAWVLACFDDASVPDVARSQALAQLRKQQWPPPPPPPQQQQQQHHHHRAAPARAHLHHAPPVCVMLNDGVIAFG